MKESTITKLEGQLEGLKSSLEAVLTEAEAKASQAAESGLDTTLQETKDALAKLTIEYEELKSNLGASEKQVSIHANMWLLLHDNISV